MVKTLPIIPSSTSQKIYLIFLFYSHIITYYSYFILFVLLFCVLTSRETCMDLMHNFVVAIV